MNYKAFNSILNIIVYFLLALSVYWGGALAFFSFWEFYRTIKFSPNFFQAVYGLLGLIACNYGQPIYAADAGTVVKAKGGWNGGYGVEIVIDHGAGKQTVYAHLNNLYMKVGESVAKGQAIGAMGSTGRSTGPHLHFEVRTGGVRRNPLYYIK